MASALLTATVKHARQVIEHGDHATKAGDEIDHWTARLLAFPGAATYRLSVGRAVMSPLTRSRLTTRGQNQGQRPCGCQRRERWDHSWLVPGFGYWRNPGRRRSRLTSACAASTKPRLRKGPGFSHGESAEMPMYTHSTVPQVTTLPGQLTEINRRIMAGAVGFEPTVHGTKEQLPYHLARPNSCGGVSIQTGGGCKGTIQFSCG